MNRRTFLNRMALGILATLFFRERVEGSEANDDLEIRSVATRDTIDLSRADGRGMQHFGRHVVSDRLCSARQVEAALCEHCAVPGGESLTPERIQARHRQDLECGNLVCVDRVYLSETEAKLCALAYCRERDRRS